MMNNKKEVNAEAGRRVCALLEELRSEGLSRDHVLSIALAEVAYRIAAERSTKAAIESLALTAGMLDASARSGTEIETAQPAGQA